MESSQPANHQAPIQCLVNAQLNRKPRISVIMPVFNVGPYLGEALESVLSQSFPDFELICINDGSTDDSLSILLDHAKKDSRISVYSQHQSGLSMARNLGIEHASGDYIYFFDSDDLLMENALGIMFEAAEKNQTDILFFNGCHFYDKSCTESELSFRCNYQRSGSYPERSRGTELFVKFSENKEYFVVVWLALYRRKFLLDRHIVFYPYLLYEDNLFTFSSIVKAERTGYLCETLCRKRVRPGSITMSVNHLEKSFSHFIMGIEMMKQWASSREFRDPRVSACTIKYMNSLFRRARLEFNESNMRSNLPEILKKQVLTGNPDYDDLIQAAKEAVSLYKTLIVETGSSPRTRTEAGGNEEKLPNYSLNNISIQISKTRVCVTNFYHEVPVNYAWYVLRDKEPILKQFYHESREKFQYEFTEPGEYSIIAFIRTKDGSKETKSLRAANISVRETMPAELLLTIKM